MDGMYFALGNIAVCVTIYWAMVNDRAQLAGRTGGLLAMTDDDAAVAVAGRSRRNGSDRRLD